MHELSIALSLIDAAAEEAAARGGLRVRAIHLRVGALSGVVSEALASAFELAREGTSLADAELAIEDVSIAVLCPECRAERALPSPQQFLCPECGAPTPEVVRGRELEIVALEVEP